MKSLEITEDQFLDQYKPIINPLVEDASYEGCMFETFGLELGLIHSALERTPLKIWTICDCDGELIICSGFSYVNRMGYLITENPVPEDTSISVIED